MPEMKFKCEKCRRVEMIHIDLRYLTGHRVVKVCFFCCKRGVYSRSVSNAPYLKAPNLWTDEEILTYIKGMVF
jgi:hypothetical protein